MKRATPSNNNKPPSVEVTMDGIIYRHELQSLLQLRSKIDNRIQALQSEMAKAKVPVELPFVLTPATGQREYDEALGTPDVIPGKPAPKKRHMSAAGRKRIAEATKRRWAEHKRQQELKANAVLAKEKAATKKKRAPKQASVKMAAAKSSFAMPPAEGVGDVFDSLTSES